MKTPQSQPKLNEAGSRVATLALAGMALAQTACTEFRGAVQQVTTPGKPVPAAAAAVAAAEKQHARNGHGPYATDKPGHKEGHVGNHLGHTHPEKGQKGMPEGWDGELHTGDGYNNPRVTLENTSPSEKPKPVVPKPAAKPGSLIFKGLGATPTTTPAAQPAVRTERVIPTSKSAPKATALSAAPKSTVTVIETIPSNGQHTVQEGENSYSIARKYGLDPAALRAMNDGVEDWSKLPVGQTLNLK